MADRLVKIEGLVETLEQKIGALERRVEALEMRATGKVAAHMDEFIAKATEEPDGPLRE